MTIRIIVQSCIIFSTLLTSKRPRSVSYERMAGRKPLAGRRKSLAGRKPLAGRPRVGRPDTGWGRWTTGTRGWGQRSRGVELETTVIGVVMAGGHERPGGGRWAAGTGRGQRPGGGGGAAGCGAEGYGSDDNLALGNRWCNITTTFNLLHLVHLWERKNQKKELK